MKMDKLFAGLIAFAAGVALSAGSAFATNGYMIGDAAMNKLIPYYETGDTTATIIGIQNMSPQQDDTKNKNADVANIKKFLGGGQLGTTDAQNTTTQTVDEHRAMDLINGEIDGSNPVTSTKILDPDTELNLKAAAEAALAKAEKAKYTEHVFIGVNVYDAMGEMMENASASLCLAENQFGVVVLQGAMDDMMMNSNQMQVLSVTDEDIPASGYVKVMAESQKYTGCDFSSRTSPPVLVDTRSIDPSADNGALSGDATTSNADSEVATWTIIQDTGDGFFGTEVGSATITMNAKVGDTDTADIACYTTPAQSGTPPTVANSALTGAFVAANCGLIPERHNNTRTTAGDVTTAPTADTATPRSSVYARYDAGDDSTVYVWLATGMDTDKTLPKDRRMLEVTVMCEDGTMPAGADADGDNKPDPIKVAAPSMVTMIDPVGDALGQYTDMCEGDRGVLKIMMPDGSSVGMAFSHIQQMMGHYRMNFPGYSMAPTAACTTAAGNCP